MNKYLLLLVVLILFFMVVLNKISFLKNKEYFNVNSSILSLNRIIIKFNEDNERPKGFESLQTLDSIII